MKSGLASSPDFVLNWHDNYSNIIMSNVTNIIISVPILTDERKKGVVQLLNKINEHDHNDPFAEIFKHRVGGNKMLECQLFIAAIECLDVEYFIRTIQDLNYSFTDDERENCQVIIMGEHDYKWNIYSFDDIEKLQDNF